MAYRDRPNGPACINKYSATPGEVLPPDSLQNGEIAVNADGTIYVRGVGGRSVAACGPGANVPATHREYPGLYGANVLPDSGEVVVNSDRGSLYVSNKVSPGGNADRSQRLRDGAWCQWSFNADGTKKVGESAVDDYNSGTMKAWDFGAAATVDYGVNEVVYTLKVGTGGVSSYYNTFASTTGTVEYWNSHSNAWTTGTSYTFPAGHWLVKARVVGSLEWGVSTQFNFGQAGTQWPEVWITSVQSCPFIDGGTSCVTIRGNVNMSGCVTFPSFAFNNGFVQQFNPPASAFEYLAYGHPRYFIADGVMKADNNIPNDGRVSTPYRKTFVPPVGAGGIDALYHSSGFYSTTWLTISGIDTSTPERAVATIRENSLAGDIADYLTVEQPDANARGGVIQYQAELFAGSSGPPKWVTSHPSVLNCVVPAEYLQNAAKHGMTLASGNYIVDHDGTDIVADVDYAGVEAWSSVIGVQNFYGGTPGASVNIFRNATGITTDLSQGSVPTATTTPRVYYTVVLPVGTPTATLGRMMKLSSTGSGLYNTVRIENADGTRGKLAPITETKGLFGNNATWNTTCSLDKLPVLDFEISDGPYFFGIDYFNNQDGNAGGVNGEIRGKFKWSKGLTDLSQMIVESPVGTHGSFLATATYDGLLEEFAGLVAEGHFDNPVTLGVSTRTTYSSAAAAHRAYLVSQGWTITDGGQA